jgi:hypothetical protein
MKKAVWRKRLVVTDPVRPITHAEAASVRGGTSEVTHSKNKTGGIRLDFEDDA